MTVYKMNKDKQKIMRGIAAAPGIAIGHCIVWESGRPEVRGRLIKAGQVSTEQRRFEQALLKAERELNNQAKALLSRREKTAAKIFQTQILMVRDQEIVRQVKDQIARRLFNAAFAYQSIVSKLENSLASASDSYLRDRAGDIAAVARFVLKHLSKARARIVTARLRNAIVLAPMLAPAEVIKLRNSGVVGFACDTGGVTSHVAILAKSWGIPAVMGMKNGSQKINANESGILDGALGLLIVKPSKRTLDQYQQLVQTQRRETEELKVLRRLPAKTRDGHYIRLVANIDVAADANYAIQSGAAGIGLFRTEYLLGGAHLPTEEEQFEAYKAVALAFNPQPVTLRTFDVGGDKLQPGEKAVDPNPFMGLRAVRACLAVPDFFKTQLRAMLRASTSGKIRIMIPMIAGQKEIEQAKQIVEDAKTELRKQKKAFDPRVELGIMVEIPAAALISEQLAQLVDFFSIGTNDLTQFTLAADRGNPRISHLYEPFHPAVLKLIQMTIGTAQHQGIECSVCGEMAGDPLAIPLLIGMGINELSVSPAVLPKVKLLIRSLRFSETRSLAEEILQKVDPKDIRQCLTNWCHKTVPDFGYRIR